MSGEVWVVCAVPVFGHYSIVVVAPVERKAQGAIGLAAARAGRSCIKDALWLDLILVDFYWDVVKFGHRLDLNVITPDFITPIISDIVTNVLIPV